MGTPAVGSSSGAGGEAGATPDGELGSTHPAGLAPAASSSAGSPAAADQAGATPPRPSPLGVQARELTLQQSRIGGEIAALALSPDSEVALLAGGGEGTFGWPERQRLISQRFGCTNVVLAVYSAVCPSHHVHTGLDIAGPDLADVYAADAGVARIFRGNTGYGNYVIITHGNGYASLYGHLHDITVGDGQVVRRGDPIAHEGSSGNSTGPHLHFEIRLDGQYLDPCPFLESCR